jgi:uncharacterized protein YdcH (DUF465 family)
VDELFNDVPSEFAPCRRSGTFAQARPRHEGGIPQMVKTTDELKAHLMETSEQFRLLAQQHSDHSRKLDDLESRPHLTSEEQVEEVKLKKIKLRLKDQMQEMMNRYRAEQAV